MSSANVDGDKVFRMRLLVYSKRPLVKEAITMRTSLSQRIEINPDILMGKPVIAGTRIPIYLILNLLASDYDEERIIKAYPILSREDIRAALWYAEQRMRYEEVYPLTVVEAPA